MNRKIEYLKYLISIIILFMCLFIVSVFYKKNTLDTYTNNISVSSIKDSNDKYIIDVDYPRFKNSSKINEVITDFIYNYVKKFKSSDTLTKSLYITYELYNTNEFINIVFNINNSLNNDSKKNIFINTDTEKIDYPSSLFTEDYLKESIFSLVFSKYSKEIYDKISNSNINDFTYIINDSKIDVYFYNIEFDNVDYDPNVSIYFDGEKYVFEENTYDENKKYIAFTFDDGPSTYTMDILNALELYNSSATFFELGNKMKSNSYIVSQVYNSNSEVASHSYSHKYLTKLNDKELNNEFNSTSVIFNEITGGDIEYIRPPYGSINTHVKNSSPYPLILWNIDPKDWLYRDSEKVYNGVINNVCDGCIVIMHDVYPETLEAVKKILPALKEMNYEIVSITKLFSIKNIEPSKNTVYRSIK